MFIDFEPLPRQRRPDPRAEDRMITRRIALDEVNDAFDNMRARRGGRAVILYG
jgi:hypothetical protein